ncbi:MAG: Ppx/GppA phosphatase family protein [Rhodospirillales bacterium]|nr:Ppx/GppA phosphatase family protein [Rhodospirillales bacterium]
MSDRPGPSFGALDLGTNNCRLLVARPKAAGFRVVDAFSRIVRLGEGVAQSGRLSEEAMGRTIGALRVCAGKLRRGGVSRYWAVATEACRRAENRQAFIDRVDDETGLSIEIISSAEEVQLALDGCTPLFDRTMRHVLLLDIGGGSTELIWVRLDDGAPATLAAWTSIGHGVVTLAERYGGDRVARASYAAMVAEIEAAIGPFAESHRIPAGAAAGTVQLLGTSGTVTTIAGIHLGLPRYDRDRVDGLRLQFGDVREVIDTVLEQDYEARAAQPCIGPGRGDVMIAGCAILDAVMAICPAGQLDVADRGLREGMLLRMMRAARAEHRERAHS